MENLRDKEHAPNVAQYAPPPEHHVGEEDEDDLDPDQRDPVQETDKRVYNKAEYYDDIDRLRDPERDNTIWEDKESVKKEAGSKMTVEKQ